MGYRTFITLDLGTDRDFLLEMVSDVVTSEWTDNDIFAYATFAASRFGGSIAEYCDGMTGDEIDAFVSEIRTIA